MPIIGFAPIPAVARVLAGFQRDQLAGFIEVAGGLLDLADPDPETEDSTDLEDDFALSPQATGYATGPGCQSADTGENAWVEWSTMRGCQKRGHNILAGHEDDEEDDAAGEDDHSGQSDEDGINTAYHLVRFTEGASGPGCNISDPGGCNHDGREPDDDGL